MHLSTLLETKRCNLRLLLVQRNHSAFEETHLGRITSCLCCQQVFKSLDVVVSLLTEQLAAHPVSVLVTCAWLLGNIDEAVSGCRLVMRTLKITEG